MELIRIVWIIAMVSIGFIGLGIMGTSIVRNIMKEGIASKITIWNRTEEKVNVRELYTGLLYI